MDREKKDLLTLWIISIITALIYLFYTYPVYTLMDKTKPTVIDDIFCIIPACAMIICPVIIKRFYGGMNINESKT